MAFWNRNKDTGQTVDTAQYLEAQRAYGEYGEAWKSGRVDRTPTEFGDWYMEQQERFPLIGDMRVWQSLYDLAHPDQYVPTIGGVQYTTSSGTGWRRKGGAEAPRTAGLRGLLQEKESEVSKGPPVPQLPAPQLAPIGGGVDFGDLSAGPEEGALTGSPETWKSALGPSLAELLRGEGLGDKLFI